MTISLKASVSGHYRATFIHKIDGVEQEQRFVVEGTPSGPAVEQSLPFRHGAENSYVGTEEYLGAQAESA